MSVTIHDVPQDYTPSDNPVMWTFSSDQTAADNFVFVVTVFVNDLAVAVELVHPDNGIYGRYNASSYASNATNSPDLSQDLSTDANNYAEIRITVLERYGNPPADEDESVASNIVVWKARMNDDDFVDWNNSSAIYIKDDIINAKFLTNFPNNINPKVRFENEQIRIMMINDGLNFANFEVNLYDDNDNLIIGDSLMIDTSLNKITIFNISPEIISASPLGITQTDFAAASYYTIFGNSTKVFRIDIDTSCVFKRYKRLHFLSHWGTVEAFSFGLVSHKAGTIKSFGYKKLFGEWEISSFVFSKNQGRDIDFAKLITEQLIIESDWLNEDVQHWLVRNLYGSVLVYEEVLSTGVLIQRKIMNTSFKDDYFDTGQLFKERVVLMLPSMTSMIL